MRRGTKKPADFLAQLPPVPPSRLAGNALLEEELARVAAGRPLTGMDTSRYSLEPPPPAKRGDPVAWAAAVDNARAQLEHQHTRLLNLELLIKYGPDAWRAHNERLALHVRTQEGEAAALRRETEALNRERKLQQTAAGRELAALEGEYLAAVRKNADIEAACLAMEAEVAVLRAAAAGQQQQQQKQNGGGQQQNGQHEGQ